MATEPPGPRLEGQPSGGEGGGRGVVVVVVTTSCVCMATPQQSMQHAVTETNLHRPVPAH